MRRHNAVFIKGIGLRDAITSKDIDNLLIRVEGAQNARNAPTYQQQKVAAKEEVSKAEAKYKNLVSSSKSTVEQVEAAKKKMDDAEKNYNNNFGGKEEEQEHKKEVSSASKSESQRKKEEEKRIAELNKRKEAQKKLSEEMLSLEEANNKQETDLMEDGNKKKVSIITNDYDNRKAEIEKKSKELAELNKKAGVNSGFLTPDQQIEIGKANSLNEKKKDKDTIEIKNAEINSMRDYLKQYGTFQEQKLAITQEYADKIAKAQTEGERKTLEKQRDSALQGVDANAQKKVVDDMKNSINWETVFNNIDNMSTETLKRISAQLQQFLETQKDLAITDIKEITDKIQQINDYIGQNNNWFYSPTQQNHDNAVKNVKVANDRFINASTDANAAKAIVSMQQNSVSDALAEVGINVSAKSIKSSDRSKYTSGLDTKSSDKVNKAFDNLAKSEQKAQNASKKQIEAGDNLAKAKQQEAETSLTFSQKVGSVGKSISTFTSKLQNLPGLIDQLGLSGTGVGNAINSGVNAANDAAGAMADYASGNYIGAASKGLSAIGNAADALGITGDSDKTLQQDIERLTISNEDLKSAIESLSDDLNKTSTANASSVYNQQVSDINQQMENTQEMMSRSGAVYKSGWKGSRSSNYRIRKGMSAEDWKRVSDAAGTSVNSAEDFWNLTSEQMANVAKNATDLYSKIKDLADNGYGDAAKYMDDYISYYKQLEEIQDAYKEKLTNTSLDTIRDDFKNALLDMESDTKTFTDNFEKMMQKAVIESMMSTTYEKKLKEWYESFSKDMNDGTLSKSEQGDLKSSWDSIVKEALAQRDALKSAMGWNTTDSQTATSNSIQNITADQSDQLIGRITAIQIAVEKANMSRDVQTSQLSAMNIPLTSINQKIGESLRISNETRDLYVESILELKTINDHQDHIEKAIKSIKDMVYNIDRNTKNL